MKRYLTTIMLLCVSCLFAQDKPFLFEIPAPQEAFHYNETYNETPEVSFSEDDTEEDISLNCSNWQRFSISFGVQEISFRFPHKPIVIQNGCLMSYYGNLHGVDYRVSGYFPAVYCINADLWFADIQAQLLNYPGNVILNFSSFVSCGDIVLEYRVHNIISDRIIQGYVIVTRLNGYILECERPWGFSDEFSTLISSFHIHDRY